MYLLSLNPKARLARERETVKAFGSLLHWYVRSLSNRNFSKWNREHTWEKVKVLCGYLQTRQLSKNHNIMQVAEEELIRQMPMLW
jgi:hypothetical protein